MKVLIVGAGASGIAAAINVKRRYPNDNVLVIEHSDKAMKKVLATGNGKCNIGNSNHDLPVILCKNRFNGYAFEDYKKYIESFEFKTRLNGNLLYPITESSQTVRNQMLHLCNKLGIQINLNEKLLDYELKNSLINVTTNKSSYMVDKLIIATGGKSSPQLGSDGSIYSILSRHGYMFNELHPGLVPVKVSENLKIIDGVRVKANVSIIQNGMNVFSEPGEVLFKKNALSGIVIFNASNVLQNNSHISSKITLDLVPEYSLEDLEKHGEKTSKSQFLSEFLQPKMIAYFRDQKLDQNLAKNLKELTFNFDGFYDYDNSQVTLGGIPESILTSHLESKTEPGVHFIGEVIDIHGPCGGYNLTWAFWSAQLLVK